MGRVVSQQVRRLCCLSLLCLSLQACIPKLVSGKPGSGSESASGQVLPGGGGSPGGGSSGGSGGVDLFVPVSSDVTVSGSTDWLDDEVECDTEGLCSRWVEL
jgi:hypothetical protein